MEIVIKISYDGTLTLVRVVGQNQVLLQFRIFRFLGSGPLPPKMLPYLGTKEKKVALDYHHSLRRLLSFAFYFCLHM